MHHTTADPQDKPGDATPAGPWYPIAKAGDDLIAERYGETESCATTIAVDHTLQRLCNDRRSETITVATRLVGKLSGCSTRTIRRHVKRLKGIGLWDVTENFSEDGSQLASTYTRLPVDGTVIIYPPANVSPPHGQSNASSQVGLLHKESALRKPSKKPLKEAPPRESWKIEKDLLSAQTALRAMWADGGNYYVPADKYERVLTAAAKEKIRPIKERIAALQKEMKTALLAGR